MQKEQALVDNWIKTYGVRYFDELTNTILLMEEVGEMSRYIARMFGEQSFRKEITKQQSFQELKSEMADVLFVLICLANQMNVDLSEALQESIQKKTDRDKNRHVDNPKLK